MHPFLILAVGIISVIVLITVARLHAFIALVFSALLVSFLVPGPWLNVKDPSDPSGSRILEKGKIERMTSALGETAGNIALVIGFASVIGSCMMASGAAARIVQAFLRLLGEKRAPSALMGSGFILAMPVFFDTVFYLLIPLARSLYKKTGKNFLLYVLAISSGGAITHTLVPPTPGPLAMADKLQVDLGKMIVLGTIVAFPAALAGLAFGWFMNKLMPIPMRSISTTTTEETSEALPTAGPSLIMALAPVLLPVIMISMKTVIDAVSLDLSATVKDVVGILGNPMMALLLSMLISGYLYLVHARPSRKQMVHLLEEAMMSAGVIILITAAGGAFGSMLKLANLNAEIKNFFGESNGMNSNVVLLLIGFGVSSVMKIAQGSSTVAMITSAGILAALITPEGSTTSLLTVDPVYLALAIGSGSLFISWMNDSGFWIVAKMSGLTETEALLTWTPLLIVLSFVGLAMTILLSQLMPLM